MNRKFTIKREARVDLLQHFTYIGQDNLAAAERFLRAAREDFKRLAAMPGMGRRRELANPELAELRSWPLTGFENYLIFYLPKPDSVDVLRVVHGARDIDAIFGT